MHAYSTEHIRVVDVYTGVHFWIIGDVYPDRVSKYSVSVDGRLFETFSSYEAKWRGFVIKYERKSAVPVLTVWSSAMRRTNGSC